VIWLTGTKVDIDRKSTRLGYMWPVSNEPYCGNVFE